MENFLVHGADSLLIPVGSEKLVSLLDLATANLDFNCWSLLQIDSATTNSDPYKYLLADKKTNEYSNAHQEIYDFYASLSNAKSNLNQSLDYFSLTNENAIVKLDTSTKPSANLEYFNYASMKLSNLDGYDYILLFDSNNATVSEMTRATLMLCGQILSNSIPSIISSNNKPMVNIGRREQQVLLWTSQGKTSYEISKILNLSEHTINNYISNVTKKLGANNRVHAACHALRIGLI